MGDSEEVRHRRKENLDKFDPELLDDEEEYEDDDEVRSRAEEEMKARDRREGRDKVLSLPPRLPDEPKGKCEATGKKQTSLFSFFKKAKPTEVAEGGLASSLSVSSLKAQAEAQALTPLVAKKRSRLGREGGTLVWGKMAGYPWWPCMLAPHPRTEEVERKVGKSAEEVHLVFLGEENTAWLPAAMLRAWGDEVDRSGGAREEGWSEGVQQAEEAEELTCEERLALLMPGSQVEDEEEGDDEGSQEEEEKKRRPKSRSREAEEPARKRRRIVMPDSSDSESEQEEEVEAILDRREEAGAASYLVRWRGFGAEGDTWEPEGNLSCRDMVEEFEARRGGGGEETEGDEEKEKNEGKEAEGETDGKSLSKEEKEGELSAAAC